MTRYLYTFIAIAVCCHLVTADSISVKENPLSWTIETKNSMYQTAAASDKNLIPVYFGAKGDLFNIKNQPIQVNPKVGSEYREIPYRGGFVNQNPILEVIFLR